MSSFRKPLTVLRYSGGYYDSDGYWQDGTAEEIQIRASVQPLSAGEVKNYTNVQPQGAFTSLMVALYSDVPFLPEKQGSCTNSMQEADIVLWQGRRMKIVRCEPWQNDVINHYRSVAQEIEEREEVEDEGDSDDEGSTEVSP